MCEEVDAIVEDCCRANMAVGLVPMDSAAIYWMSPNVRLLPGARDRKCDANDQSQ